MRCDRSSMKASAQLASRSPTIQLQISLVSASMLVHVHTSPAPSGAAFAFARFCGLGVVEAPNLIDLHALAGEAAHVLIVERGSRTCRRLQQLGDGVDARAGDARDGPHAAAFAEHLQDLHARLEWAACS